MQDKVGRSCTNTVKQQWSVLKPTLMGTKNLNENGLNPFFGGWDQKYGQTKSYGNGLVRHGFDNKSKLVYYAGEIQNEIIEWKWPPIFQNNRVRYARADELKLYSSSATLPVKRRHEPMPRFYSSLSRIIDG